MDSHEVQLASCPDGAVEARNFRIETADVPELGPGLVLVRLRRLGLNAGLANRIGGPDTAYGPGIRPGDVPASDGVVEVLASRSNLFRQGDLAVRKSLWRSVDVAAAEELRRIPALEEDLPLEAHLTVLGHVGFTAYTGMMRFGGVQAADSVFVSGAAGGVGSCAVQFAKAVGATVVGSAGSAQKVRLLSELGADATFNHHDGAALDLLRAAAPEGIDLFYDNVGGEQLDAAMEMLRFGGRVVICGAASQYGKGGERRGPANYMRMIYRQLTMRGFDVTSNEDLRQDFEADANRWLRAGKIRSVHTVIDGFGRIPEAFASLLSGGNSGRMIVNCDG
ncbi:MDR family NADP-dependent oxidoreductase [Arthrobacter sp. H14-L1]|uniref:MDR family NADP-dependent oxidoreductase n=1 Tax=Arthrobacter sp. H14-L1 TaxID=2996697 RepID=UPI002271AF17|nr:NADP-dependent oxidoreductase [Arthrobacter sp. H14-L1]MCY0906094.1 NADP-dependent oxidoreductase [Arthrobacter sp. H14-L1]